MARSSYVFLTVVFLVVATQYHVISSSPHSNNPPSASPSFLPSTISNKPNTDGNGYSSVASSSALTNNEEPSKKNPSSRSPKSSSVTFLYELYEHEIYNPKTDSWTSRRFTQSPITGGGGRDSTSLNPQSCSPPRNYLFDDEWKIDMASESRDGFGWEYYVGKYDGLGRRRRRWVRTLRRISSSSGSLSSIVVPASTKKSIDANKKKQKSTTVANKAKVHHPNLLRAIREQYNFKGFGWSFYKSFLIARSFGAAFRMPLSANFDCYDKYLAAPYISSATYFGYPWVIATFLSASVPLDAIKWLIGGVIWKIQYFCALASALIRGVIEAAMWIILSPWRVWRAFVQMMATFAGRFGMKKQEELTKSLIDNIDEVVVHEDTTKSIIDSGEGTNVTIETHIEINNSSVSATAVVDSPRGGASNTNTAKRKKKHLTVSGKEIPTFHRTTSLEYSSTIQERIGMCISWRVSQERGHEYRFNFVYTCLPTFLFWRQLEEERKRRMEGARRFIGVWGKRNDPSSAKRIGTIEADEIDGKKDSSSSRSESKSLSNSRSKSQSRPPILSSFLSEHSSTLGITGGWPLPIYPFFASSLMLSLSGFYYGWLLKYIRSLFALPSSTLQQIRLKDKDLGRNTTISSTDNDSLRSSSEKLVSSALKEKLPLEKTSGLLDIEDEAFITNNTQIDFGSDLENMTDTELNVAGV